MHRSVHLPLHSPAAITGHPAGHSLNLCSFWMQRHIRVFIRLLTGGFWRKQSVFEWINRNLFENSAPQKQLHGTVLVATKKRGKWIMLTPDHPEVQGT
jgi:hypothetical protein